MTGPNPSSAGGGDDYVAARLSIDIPDGAAEGIRAITTEVERYRTTLEAAAHAEAEVGRYLEQMTEATNTAAAAQQNLVAQLQTYLSLMGRGGMPGMQPSTGVPAGGAIAPFGGMGAGGEFQTGGLGSPVGERPPNPSDVASQLGTAPTTNPREYLNMKTGRGGVNAQDLIGITHESIQELADKIASREHAQREQDLHTRPGGQQGHEQERHRRAATTTPQHVQQEAGLVGQVLTEMQQGSKLGLGQMAMGGLQQLVNHRRHPGAGEQKEEAEGDTAGKGGSDKAAEKADSEAAEEGDGISGAVASGAGGAIGGAAAKAAGKAAGGGAAGGVLGGIMSKLGPIAGVATAALGAFQVAQKGGEFVQGMRNVASVRGGGAGEGAQVELKARMLSMNPFITQDQARQVYQAVMSEGYAGASGAGADNVIDFMKTNLTTMNISVADSAKMLRATVTGSGKGDPASVSGSVEMLRHELDQIRSLSRNSAISTPDYTRQVEGVSQKLMAGGAGPQEAADAAIVSEEYGSDDQVLKGQFSMAAGDLSSGAKAGGLFRAFGGPGGTAMRDIPNRLMPNMIPAWLTSENRFPEAVNNVLTHFAKQAAQMDRGGGDKVSEMNAVGFFQRYVQMVAPDMDAAHDMGAAKALYHSLLAGQEMGAAEHRAQDQGVDITPHSGGGGGGGGSIAFQPQAPSSPSPAPEDGGGGGGGGEGAPAHGGGGGGQRVGAAAGGASMAKVQVGLTPEATKLLQVLGPQQVSLAPNKANANRGVGGASVNSG